MFGFVTECVLVLFSCTGSHIVKPSTIAVQVCISEGSRAFSLGVSRESNLKSARPVRRQRQWCKSTDNRDGAMNSSTGFVFDRRYSAFTTTAGAGRERTRQTRKANVRSTRRLSGLRAMVIVNTMATADGQSTVNAPRPVPFYVGHRSTRYRPSRRRAMVTVLTRSSSLQLNVHRSPPSRTPVVSAR